MEQEKSVAEGEAVPPGMPERKTEEAVGSRPEFRDLIGMFMSRTGQSREQAVAWLANLFDRMNIDPERNFDEARRQAERMMGLLEMLPESRFKQAAMEAVGAKALYDASQRPSPEDRMARIMEAIAPYFAIAPAMREMARVMGGGSDGSPDPRLAAMEAKLESVEEKLKEKPIEELKRAVEEIRKDMAELKAGPRKEDEGSKVVEELRAVKEAISKKERDEQLAKLEKQGEELQKMIDDLRYKMSRPAEERPRDVVDEMSMFADKASKFFDGIANLARSMGYAKEDEIIKGEDRFSKILQFGDRALRELRRMAETWKQPAPAREVVQTAPVTPAPAPNPESSPAQAEAPGTETAES